MIHYHQYHTVMRHLDIDLEARREWNEVILRIKAGESPQSVAERKALDFIVLEESRLPKTRHFGKARNWSTSWRFKSNDLARTWVSRWYNQKVLVPLQKTFWKRSAEHTLSVRWVRCVSWPVPRRIETHSTPRSIWRPLCSCKRISPERRNNWKKYLKLLAELDLPIWSHNWRKYLKLLAELDLPISRMNFMVVVKHQHVPTLPPGKPESNLFVVIMALICFDHLELLLWELLGLFAFFEQLFQNIRFCCCWLKVFLTYFCHYW